MCWNKRSDDSCFQCCDTDYCNAEGCGKPGINQPSNIFIKLLNIPSSAHRDLTGNYLNFSVFKFDVTFILALPSRDRRGPICYNCTAVSKLYNCYNITTCAKDEVCIILLFARISVRISFITEIHFLNKKSIELKFYQKVFKIKGSEILDRSLFKFVF